METIMSYVLLIAVIAMFILGMGSLLWSDYQNHQQSKKDEALNRKRESLKAKFMEEYGGEDKFYHDMVVAYDIAREAASALSMQSYLERYEPECTEDIARYREEHKAKAEFYYANNPEFKLRDYINSNL